MSQVCTPLTDPLHRASPVGDQARAITGFWTSQTRPGFREELFHKQILLSCPAEASVLPSGDQHMPATISGNWCPSRECISRPDSASHRVTAGPAPAAASDLPSGDQAST